MSRHVMYVGLSYLTPSSLTIYVPRGSDRVSVTILDIDLSGKVHICVVRIIFTPPIFFIRHYPFSFSFSINIGNPVELEERCRDLYPFDTKLNVVFKSLSVSNGKDTLLCYGRQWYVKVHTSTLGPRKSSYRIVNDVVYT